MTPQREAIETLALYAEKAKPQATLTDATHLQLASGEAAYFLGISNSMLSTNEPVGQVAVFGRFPNDKDEPLSGARAAKFCVLLQYVEGQTSRATLLTPRWIGRTFVLRESVHSADYLSLITESVAA